MKSIIDRAQSALDHLQGQHGDNHYVNMALENRIGPINGYVARIEDAILRGKNPEGHADALRRLLDGEKREGYLGTWIDPGE